MNKAFNTFLFMVAATIANILTMAVFLLVPMVVFTRFLSGYVPDFLRGPIYLVIAIAAILGTFLVYNKVMDKIVSKVDMEKYFHPIFKPKPRKR